MSIHTRPPVLWFVTYLIGIGAYPIAILSRYIHVYDINYVAYIDEIHDHPSPKQD